MISQIKCPVCKARLADKGDKKCIVNARCNKKEDCNLEIKCYKCKNKVYISIEHEEH